MKIKILLLLILIISGCSSKTQMNIINIKTDKLGYEFISNDIVLLLKNIYPPAKTPLVLNTKDNAEFSEYLENYLRQAGYSLREIQHIKATIHPNEKQLKYIIDKINDSSEEKKIKKINNDTSVNFRVSIIINNTLYTRMYGMYNNYEIAGLSAWLEIDLTSSSSGE